jgi:hypothetical protein
MVMIAIWAGMRGWRCVLLGMLVLADVSLVLVVMMFFLFSVE